MPKRALREALEQLDRELAETGSIDDEARAMLADLSGDIERLLAEEERDDDSSLSDRLTAATERFEESHPRLTAVIGRLADALANLGI